MSTALIEGATRTAPELHALDVLARVAAGLGADPRFSQDLVTRPHPLIVCVQRNESYAVIAPAHV
ncbi:MAG TPA: hypothetical protein VGH87_22995, partial [Polyangiaceae bacterium]